MPRLTLQSTNFTAGEISPRLAGRVDIDRYQNAAKTLLNAHPVVHGGAKRRAGTRYVSAIKDVLVKSRLVPFVYSRDLSFMLEFGHLYVRVWPAGGGAMIQELSTSFTSTHVQSLDFTQSDSSMFLFNENVAPQRLSRDSLTGVWSIAAASFAVVPFDEQGYVPGVSVTLSNTAVGTGRTITALSSVFLPTDVGRQFLLGEGVAVVTAYTSGTVLTVDVLSAFSLNTGITNWSLDSSPQAIVKPSASDPVASIIDLTGSQTRAANLTLSAKTGAITVTASASVFTAGDVGKQIFGDTGVATITGFTSGTSVAATTVSDFLSTSYAQGGYGITEATWRSGDVGSYVRINGGLVKITSFSSSSVVKGRIVTALTSAVASPPLAWSLETPVWNLRNGYPRTGTIHEQRLVVGGSTKYPQTIWGSRTGEYLDFTKGTDDADAWSFTIASDQVNPIGYLSSLRNLVVHTYGGEFSVQGGVEKPITPTNVRIRPESTHGSRGVRPVEVGKESVFVQRAGRKVRAMGYRYDFDGYASPDLAVLAEHITEGGVSMLAYQQEPDLLLWAVRGDGALLSCTLDRDQQVIGWARHTTDGNVESVATIPNGDREETWVIVRRILGNTEKRYLELFDETFAPLAGAETWGSTVDCGLTFDLLPGQLTVSLPHLAGKTVDIVADGAVQPQQVVANDGTVTLARQASRVLVGLHFDSEVELLTPEAGTGQGTAQGQAMRTSELVLRFLNTIGATVQADGGDAQPVPFRQLGLGVLNQRLQPFTGLMRVEMLGWDKGSSEITVRQSQPLPMHLLSAIRTFTVNAG